MSLFIGNPRWEDLRNKYSLNIMDSYYTPQKDDIYGVEFCGIPTNDDKVSSADAVTPYGLVKAQRLYSSQYCNFTPGDPSNNYPYDLMLSKDGAVIWEAGTPYPGIDEFALYAGPFMLRECAMQYDSTAGKQKIVAYKDRMTMDEWTSTYDNPTANYNIMIEFPKFWYCRPSKYTFLVSTKPNRDPIEYNGIQYPWHIAPMFERQINVNDPTEYAIYDYAYIGKYQVSTFSSKTNPPFVINQRAAAQINVSNLEQYGLYQIDYAAFASLYMLTFVKYATLQSMLYFNFPKKLNDTKVDNVSEAQTFLDLEKDNVYRNLYYQIYSSLYAHPVPIDDDPNNRGITNNLIQDIVYQQKSCKMLGLIDFHKLYIGYSLYGYNAKAYVTSYLGNLQKAHYQYIRDGLYSYVYDFPEGSASGTFGNFYWTSEMALNKNIAWVLLPDYCLQSDASLSFIDGIHYFHFATDNSKMFSNVGPFGIFSLGCGTGCDVAGHNNNMTSIYCRPITNDVVRLSD